MQETLNYCGNHVRFFISCSKSCEVNSLYPTYLQKACPTVKSRPNDSYGTAGPPLSDLLRNEEKSRPALGRVNSCEL